MGRITTIHRFNIFISEEGEEYIIPDSARKFVEKKFKEFPLQVQDNQLAYSESGSCETYDFCINMDPVNLALLILNLEQKWTALTGTFTYEDDQTGGSSHGIIYFLGGKAIHYEFDTDFNETGAATHKHKPNVTKLTYRTPLVK